MLNGETLGSIPAGHPHPGFIIAKAGTAGTDLGPGDDYDHHGPNWSEILQPHGWERGPSRGEVVYWRRPGKDGRGISVSTGYCKGQDGAG